MSEVQQSVPKRPEIRYSEKIDLLIPALIEASKKIKHATKDAQNTHLRNNYATLESVIEACKEPLLENGIIVMQFATKSTLTTRLQHTSTQFCEVEMEIILPKADMQGLGSAITYARRQSLTALLNMSQTDDDGLDASKKEKVQRPVKAATQQKDAQSKSKLENDSF